MTNSPTTYYGRRSPQPTGPYPGGYSPIQMKEFKVRKYGKIRPGPGVKRFQFRNLILNRVLIAVKKLKEAKR